MREARPWSFPQSHPPCPGTPSLLCTDPSETPMDSKWMKTAQPSCVAPDPGPWGAGSLWGTGGAPSGQGLCGGHRWGAIRNGFDSPVCTVPWLLFPTLGGGRALCHPPTRVLLWWSQPRACPSWVSSPLVSPVAPKRQLAGRSRSVGLRVPKAEAAAGWATPLPLGPGPGQGRGEGPLGKALRGCP